MTDPEIIEIIDSESDDETIENGKNGQEHDQNNQEPIRLNISLNRRNKRKRDESSFSNPFESSDEQEEDKSIVVEGDDDEVMIIDPPPKKIVGPIHLPKSIPAPQTKKTKASNKKKEQNKDEKTASDDDIEIEYCGMTNAQVFPHMRQHCTKYPFWIKKQKGRKQNNKQYCDKCYCFVCDVPVTECSDWNVHCGATDAGTQRSKWKNLRDEQKTKKLQAS